jgi:hypothetical protein
MATANFFMSQPKIVQLAMVNGLLKGNDWASSPQGKDWQKKNADLLGVVNYFSPTHTIDAIASALKSGKAADLGSIGGMPFGVITTILKNQGVQLPDTLSSDATNPKTGEAYVQHLPTTDKARLQQGLTDLIGSMFSYPGATVGLPSKSKTMQDYVPGLKINPSEQQIKKGAPADTVPVPTLASKPSGMPSNTPRIPVPAAPKVMPVYKGGAPRGPKVKNHAIKPANSQL